jgi:hypothetical protein
LKQGAQKSACGMAAHIEEGGRKGKGGGQFPAILILAMERDLMEEGFRDGRVSDSSSV